MLKLVLSLLDRLGPVLCRSRSLSRGRRRTAMRTAMYDAPVELGRPIALSQIFEVC